MQIRPLNAPDLPEVTAIYAYHVKYGTGSFEVTPPTLEEMHQRWQHVNQQGWPYLVACGELEGQQNCILGYAYAGAFRPRPAYRYSVEDSIYVHPKAQKKSVGRFLLAELMSQCEIRGARQIIAVIGDSGNTGSIKLHRSTGFQDAGLLPATGWKFGRWLDTVFMQRELGMGAQSPVLPG